MQLSWMVDDSELGQQPTWSGDFEQVDSWPPPLDVELELEPEPEVELEPELEPPPEVEVDDEELPGGFTGGFGRSIAKL